MWSTSISSLKYHTSCLVRCDKSWHPVTQQNVCWEKSFLGDFRSQAPGQSEETKRTSYDAGNINVWCLCGGSSVCYILRQWFHYAAFFKMCPTSTTNIPLSMVNLIFLRLIAESFCFKENIVALVSCMLKDNEQNFVVQCQLWTSWPMFYHHCYDKHLTHGLNTFLMLAGDK